jgi:predicted dehydrogenase
VAIVGCGRIGHVRAAALRREDELVGCTDIDTVALETFAAEHGCRPCPDLDDLLALSPDVAVVATSHDQLAPLAERALEAGAHVLVEKPAGIRTGQIDRLLEVAAATGRIVRVGFNHRFHPGLMRASHEVHSGQHGDLMFVRGRYGHGGRLGYEREWRARFETAGGGELVDQGMHLLDLVHRLAGPLPLHSALLRTQFWDAAVEDNAALVLGVPDDRTAPWALLHVSWTEWKNMFSLEIYCRHAKLQVDGLVRSYGPQTLRIYRMKPELGPPDVEQVTFSGEDQSWSAEWLNLIAALGGSPDEGATLTDARYAWTCIEDAYANSPYGRLREQALAR